MKSLARNPEPSQWSPILTVGLKPLLGTGFNAREGRGQHPEYVDSRVQRLLNENNANAELIAQSPALFDGMKLILEFAMSEPIARADYPPQARQAISTIRSIASTTLAPWIDVKPAGGGNDTPS